MITRCSWEDFKSTGLLWWINQILHTFGWAIVIVLNDDEKVIDSYPARVKYRGFSTDIISKGYQKVSKYMEENAHILHQEAKED
jgi:hypothetical protein